MIATTVPFWVLQAILALAFTLILSAIVLVLVGPALQRRRRRKWTTQQVNYNAVVRFRKPRR
jgi:hypothetical protein